jgi:hypothetical protein
MLPWDWMYTRRLPVALNARLVISSTAPVVVDVIVTAAELEPAAIVIKKSMKFAPLTVLDVDPFDDKPM